MARSEEEKHWLLKRQLQGHAEESIPNGLLQAVSKAYRIFDDNYLRLKLILRRKIYQLVEANAKLQELLHERDQQLDADRERLQKLIYNFNRDEVISHQGSFTWYTD